MGPSLLLLLLRAEDGCNLSSFSFDIFFVEEGFLGGVGEGTGTAAIKGVFGVWGMWRTSAALPDMGTPIRGSDGSWKGCIWMASSTPILS
eukprot:scaffold36660_cov33-Tisochrysis_lutea.AAC.3